jgi:hypothetical protein
VAAVAGLAPASVLEGAAQAEFPAAVAQALADLARVAVVRVPAAPVPGDHRAACGKAAAPVRVQAEVWARVTPLAGQALAPAAVAERESVEARVRAVAEQVRAVAEQVRAVALALGAVARGQAAGRGQVVELAMAAPELAAAAERHPGNG